MGTESKISQIINSGDIGTLSTSLLNKLYVHSLPTQLLMRAHNRVELQHLENPRDKRLQIAHTHLFLEFELREIEHFDTDPNFFTPSNTKWPFEFEPDEVLRIEEFNKKKPIISTPKRFKKLEVGIIRRRRKRRGQFKEETGGDSTPSKKRTQETINRNNLLEKHSEALDFAQLLINSARTRRIFKQLAVRTWNIQPDSGNIPIGNGPRPKREFWYKTIFPPMGAYQSFMQRTLNAFYRHQTPPWAIQEWDIRLTVTNDDGVQVIEKRRFITTAIGKTNILHVS